MEGGDTSLLPPWEAVQTETNGIAAAASVLSPDPVSPSTGTMSLSRSHGGLRGWCPQPLLPLGALLPSLTLHTGPHGLLWLLSNFTFNSP